MKIWCVEEHNGNDSILHANNFVGAYTRGETKDIALQKMTREVASYLEWKGEAVPDSLETIITQEKASVLTISDAAVCLARPYPRKGDVPNGSQNIWR